MLIDFETTAMLAGATVITILNIIALQHTNVR